MAARSRLDETDWWGLLHAIFILGLIPGELSSVSLLDAFRRVIFDEHNNLSDWVSSYWPALFRNKTEFTTAPLREIAENKSLRWYARSQAADCVLAAAVDEGSVALEPAVDWLAKMCGDPGEDADFRVVAGHTLLDFPRERESPKVGRNDPCPCGSGKKYKKCCLNTLH